MCGCDLAETRQSRPSRATWRKRARGNLRRRKLSRRTCCGVFSTNVDPSFFDSRRRTARSKKSTRSRDSSNRSRFSAQDRPRCRRVNIFWRENSPVSPGIENRRSWAARTLWRSDVPLRGAPSTKIVRVWLTVRGSLQTTFRYRVRGFRAYDRRILWRRLRSFLVTGRSSSGGRLILGVPSALGKA